MRTMAVLIVLVVCGLCPGWQVLLLAEDACGEQPDFTAEFLQLNADDPNRPHVEDANLPILGPIPTTGSVWKYMCGKDRRIGGNWCDPEGQECTLTVVSADIPCEAAITQPHVDPNGVYVMGEWSLSFPEITPDWHVIHVRLTDTPPPQADPANIKHTDVLFVFKGYYDDAANRAPVLMGYVVYPGDQ